MGAGEAVSAQAAPVPPPAPAVPAEGYEAAARLYAAEAYAEAARAFARYSAQHPTSLRAADALFYEADALLAAGDDAGALARFGRFRRLYSRHPLAPRARLALGTFFYGEGRYEEAAASLRETLAERTPPADEAAARYLLGQSLLALGRTDEAVAEFTRTAAVAPDDPLAPRALYAAGTARIEAGDFAGAQRAFEPLARTYPASASNRQAGLALADALARLGRFQDAADEVQLRLPTLPADEQPRAYFLLGESRARLGDAAGARAAFAAVTPESAFGRRARYGLARLDYAEGRLDEAVAGFAQVRVADPSEFDRLSHESAYYEGLALRRLGQLGEADRRLAAAQIRRPEGPLADAALFELGVLRYERRDEREAAKAFETLLETYPQSPLAGEAARLLGEAYAVLRDFTRARQAAELAERLGSAPAGLAVEVDFQQAYGLYERADYRRATDALHAIYEGDPRGVRGGEALFWSAEAAFQAGQAGEPGQLARAERLFDRFLREYPAHRQADAARYAVGWTLFRAADYARAATAFERFLSAYDPSTERVPYASDALLRLGDSYYALRRYDEAEAVYARAERTGRLRGDGADYAAFQRGQTLAARGDGPAAVAAFDAALRNFPQSALRPAIRFAKGQTLFEEGDYGKAVAQYDSLVAVHPESPLAARARYATGDAYYNRGDYRQAERAYRDVLERYPQSPYVADALTGLQYALNVQGRSAEAAAALRAFVDANPGGADTAALQFQMAEVAFQSGDLQSAVDGLQRFLREYPRQDRAPGARLLLARAYEGLGRSADAVAQYRAVLSGPADADSPPRPGGERPEAALRLGRLLLADDRPAEAYEVFAALENTAPSGLVAAEALLGQGRALLAQSRPDDAAARLTTALTAAAGQPLGREVRVVLAQSYEAQGRPEAAMEEYAALTSTDFVDAAAARAVVARGRLLLAAGEARPAADALLNVDQRLAGYPEEAAGGLLVRARALRALGKTAEATQVLRRIVRSYPDTAAAADAQREL